MTTTDPITDLATNGTAATDWDAQFAELRTRFPGAKDSVLFCVHALQQDADIQIDDLKAQAAMHGVRVTAASVAAAQRLLAPAAPATTHSLPTELPRPEPAPRVRRTRARNPEHQADLETMLRQVVARANGDAEAKTAKLRQAILKAIEVLRAAVE